MAPAITITFSMNRPQKKIECSNVDRDIDILFVKYLIHSVDKVYSMLAVIIVVSTTNVLRCGYPGV